MSKLAEIKTEKEAKVNQLLKECSVFFAFSPKQFEENKTPLADGEKYVSMGGGGYLPKSQIENFNKGIDSINEWFKAQTKNIKLRKQNIIYELCNHEAFYTFDILDTLDALGEGYTKEEVQAVFNIEVKKAKYKNL